MKLFSIIVEVQIGLRTKKLTRDISWSVSPTCASQDALSVASNAFYKQECALVVGHSYTVTCTSYTGEGWNSNLLIIENYAYCEHFTNGIEETANITISGIIYIYFIFSLYLVCTISLAFVFYDISQLIGAPSQQLSLIHI